MERNWNQNEDGVGNLSQGLYQEVIYKPWLEKGPEGSHTTTKIRKKILQAEVIADAIF